MGKSRVWCVNHGFAWRNAPQGRQPDRGASACRAESLQLQREYTSEIAFVFFKNHYFVMYLGLRCVTPCQSMLQRTLPGLIMHQ